MRFAALGLVALCGMVSVLALRPTSYGCDGNTWVNVKCAPYGAIGDGVADDTPAFLAALQNIASSGGGVLFLPPGIYVVRQSLHLPSYTTVQGSGVGVTTVRQGAGAYVGGVITAPESPRRYFVDIRDLTIDGNRSQNPSGYTAGIQLSECNYSHISNVEVVACSDGIVLRRWSSLATVQRCRVSDCIGHGFNASGSDQSVSQSVFAQQLRIRACIIQDAGQAAGTGDGGAGMNLHRCLWATVSASLCVYRSSVTQTHSFAAFRTTNSSTNIALSGNIAAGWAAGMSFYSRAYQPVLANEVEPELSVFGNVLEGCRSNGLTLFGGRGCVVANTTRNAISAVLVTQDDFSKAGVFLWQPTLFPPQLNVIAHNMVYDEYPVMQRYGISSVASGSVVPDWNVLCYNMLVGFSVAPVRVDAAQNTTVQANLVSSQ